MDKIPSLFERSKSGKISDRYSNDVLSPTLDWVATEKLDGANVRLTVRSGNLVRLEVRKNPSLKQKENGIYHPWYRDAASPEARDGDYWLWRAAENTPLHGVPDGEWSGEAVGPKIQGNPLELEKPVVYLFSLIPWRDSLASSVLLPQVIDRVPLDYDSLSEWLPLASSSVNPDQSIEGVVWWHFDEPVAKIKLKDFYG
jgi:hypothetical protein